MLRASYLNLPVIRVDWFQCGNVWEAELRDCYIDFSYLEKKQKFHIQLGPIHTVLDIKGCPTALGR